MLIANKDYLRLHDFFRAMHRADIAEILAELDHKEAAFVLRTLPKSEAAEVFTELETKDQQELILAFTDEEVVSLVEEMYVDDAVDFIEELPANIIKSILRMSSHESRQTLNRFMEYPEDSAGSIMTAEYLRLQPSMTVQEGIDRLRSDRKKVDANTIVFVTANDNRLYGVISLYDLLLSDDGMALKDFPFKETISVDPHDDQEDVLQIFRKYDFQALAVTDSENRMIGVINSADILEIADEEATEDYELMAALRPSEDAYLAASAWDHAKKRLPWLMVLLLSGMLNGAILGGFEHVFVTYPILVTFIPMLTDTGGNAGSQSSTLVIRGLALSEISISDSLKVLWKELKVSLIVGIGVVALTFTRVLTMKDGDVMSALTICIALYVIVMLSNLLGGVLPIFAKKIKQDPALMASPVITTVVDAIGLIVYFTAAKLLLNI